MLLRSSSSPLLNSWIPHHYSSSSPSPDHHHYNNNNNDHTLHLHLPRTHSISALTTTSLPSPNADNSHPSLPSPLSSKHSPTGMPPFQRMFSSSGLGEAVEEKEEEEDAELETLTEGGCGDGRDGVVGGGFSDGDCNSNGSDHGHGRDMEEYYLNMIKANPGNPLLLGNYAKYLKEVQLDLAKAEEYCGRAILASPSDANMLALYADIIWQTQRDAQRAEAYFQQAVENAPDNSYVLASYAKFLWDMEGEENDEIDGLDILSTPKYFEGTPHHSPLAAS